MPGPLPLPTRRELLLASLAGTAFVVLSWLVASANGTLHRLDVAARNAFRPDDVWGTVQVRADMVVEGLEPSRVLPVYVVLVALLAWRRRSWRAVLHALVLLAVAGVPALLVKRAVARTDPHHVMSSAGSFPSGHVLVLLVCVGGLLLLVRGAPRWWEWALVLLVDLAMAVSLLLQATHWLTDVVAGILLGAAALAATAHLAPGRAGAAPPPRAAAAAPRAPRRSAGARP
jgi:membrane-associated phospholipid phosphatase